MDKSVIIIGAGIAGLSAGCYARMNGYGTCIFEMHDKPGGLCTAWQRKDYTIDGCLHWLVGSAPGMVLHDVWKELGALQGQRIVNLEQFYRIEDASGKAFNVYSDASRLEEHMIELAPEDVKLTSECAKAIRHFARFNMPMDKAPELYNITDGVKMMFKMLPFFADLRKWGRMPMKNFAQQFKNSLLREAWQQFWPSEFSTMAALMTMAWLHQKTAGYIIGGSMELSRAIEKRYLGLGGEIRYKSRVTRILVGNDRAVGIKLADGSEHRADYVISAADGHATIFDMLDGKYVSEKIRRYYEELPIFSPLIYIGLGVNRSFEDVPQMVSGLIFQLDKPVAIGGEERKWLGVRIHNFDPSLAPLGKTVLTVMIDSNYPYWELLRKDMARYKSEKEQIADTVVTLLGKRFPGLAAQVEMCNIATPMTFHRYTGNWQGSYEGWLITPETMMLRMSKTLAGLDSFYMIGQWVQPGGGLPSGAMTGRHVIQIFCKRDNKPFVTMLP